MRLTIWGMCRKARGISFELAFTRWLASVGATRETTLAELTGGRRS